LSSNYEQHETAAIVYPSRFLVRACSFIHGFATMEASAAHASDNLVWARDNITNACTVAKRAPAHEFAGIRTNFVAGDDQIPVGRCVDEARRSANKLRFDCLVDVSSTAASEDG